MLLLLLLLQAVALATRERGVAWRLPHLRAIHALQAVRVRPRISRRLLHARRVRLADELPLRLHHHHFGARLPLHHHHLVPGRQLLRVRDRPLEAAHVEVGHVRLLPRRVLVVDRHLPRHVILPELARLSVDGGHDLPGLPRREEVALLVRVRHHHGLHGVLCPREPERDALRVLLLRVRGKGRLYLLRVRLLLLLRG